MSIVPPTDIDPQGAVRMRVFTALPDLALSLAFLITWIAPLTFAPKAVSYFLLVMLMEFIIIHSAGFMGSVVFNKPLSTRIKVKMLLGLGAFYGLFAVGFSVGFQAWWPLWTILLLTLNRILIVLLGDIPDGRERVFIQKGWAASTMFYLLFVFVTLFLPLPALGITDEVIRLQAFTSSGIWIDAPHRVMAFGFLYFLATAVSELYSHRWLSVDHLPDFDGAAGETSPATEPPPHLEPAAS